MTRLLTRLRVSYLTQIHLWDRYGRCRAPDKHRWPPVRYDQPYLGQQ